MRLQATSLYDATSHLIVGEAAGGSIAFTASILREHSSGTQTQTYKSQWKLLLMDSMEGSIASCS